MIDPFVSADRRHPARSESGFTLLELLIVVSIVAVLMAIVWAAMSGAKRNSRAHATTAAATSVARAMSSFNRMNPPITSDRLTSATTWTSTQTEAGGGFYSTTGERLLDPWPENPYSGRPIVINRGVSCPATAPAGTVWVCRLGGARPSAFRVRAWALNGSNASYVVYDQSFG